MERFYEFLGVVYDLNSIKEISLPRITIPGNAWKDLQFDFSMFIFLSVSEFSIRKKAGLQIKNVYRQEQHEDACKFISCRYFALSKHDLSLSFFQQHTIGQNFSQEVEKFQAAWKKYHDEKNAQAKRLVQYEETILRLEQELNELKR